MRKTLLLIVFIALGMALYAGNNSKRVILPGKGKLDVERFNKEVNLKTDLSKLSLAELRVLKNAFKAREGFIFKEADLRGIYGQTSWYDSIMWNRAGCCRSRSGKAANRGRWLRNWGSWSSRSSRKRGTIVATALVRWRSLDDSWQRAIWGRRFLADKD